MSFPYENCQSCGHTLTVKEMQAAVAYCEHCKPIVLDALNKQKQSIDLDNAMKRAGV